jgi:hypothetical protein
MSSSTLDSRPAAGRVVRDARPPRPRHPPRHISSVIDLYLNGLNDAQDWKAAADAC